MSSGRVSRHARIRMIAAVATVCALSAAPLAPQAVAADTPPYSETYRPQFHFTPEKNWMNDPNGLVYYKGEYHLFYQYNPNGNSWGDMSWGHAVSQDLVHWEELPLAISHDDEEMVFSGSAVVDRDNTTGFGTKKNPAMVAIYTSAYKDGGNQDQSLAYSTDRGRTWTKYEGNPVLDIGSKEFRDPKVQWYEPTKSWLMTVSLSTERKVRFYSSKNLKDWDAAERVRPGRRDRWRVGVPGPVPAAGRRRQEQHQVGAGRQHQPRWHRRRFGRPVLRRRLRRHDVHPRRRRLLHTADRDRGGGLRGELRLRTLDDDRHRVRRRAGGRGAGRSGRGRRLRGQAPRQQLPRRRRQHRHPHLARVHRRHPLPELHGRRRTHPHDPGAVLDQDRRPGHGPRRLRGRHLRRLDATGRRVRHGSPPPGTLPGPAAGVRVPGQGLVNTFLNDDSTTGTLTSPEFTITAKHINFLIGGGNHPTGAADPTAINLLVDGQVVRTATGSDNESLNWASWDVRDLAGQTARIRIVDQNTGGWGHINVDHILQSDTAGPARLQRDVRQPRRRRRDRAQRHRPQQRDPGLGLLRPAALRRASRCRSRSST